MCHFRQWLDLEQSKSDAEHVEREAQWAAYRWQRMQEEERAEERRRKSVQEDLARKKRASDKAKAEREAEREKKRERARRAHEAGPEAIAKGKFPRRTQ